MRPELSRSHAKVDLFPILDAKVRRRKPHLSLAIDDQPAHFHTPILSCMCREKPALRQPLAQFAGQPESHPNVLRPPSKIFPTSDHERTPVDPRGAAKRTGTPVVHPHQQRFLEVFEVQINVRLIHRQRIRPRAWIAFAPDSNRTDIDERNMRTAVVTPRSGSQKAIQLLQKERVVVVRFPGCMRCPLVHDSPTVQKPASPPRPRP